MSTSAAQLEWLLSPAAIETGIDRKMLAGMLLELARNVDANVGREPNGVVPFDPRLEQLRNLLLGREIELSRHFSEVLDDPEQLALAVSRVLPAAIAQASARDERLGQVLAPALSSSVKRDPNTLVDVLHPLIMPTIGKAIDATLQKLNETLKYSLTWRGLKWRWEAWRTGSSFAEVVVKHTLVYQVEHVFLIHRDSGLLIAHATAPDAASQDPQLVSSMLAAIQDFVRDSFSEQQGLDSLRLGELRVWSEPGPFATLVAVIRGNPPEHLHEIFRSTLARIHSERREALERFDGDSSTFGDVEAALTACVQLRQEAARPKQRGFARLLLAAAAAALLALAGTWGYQRWQDARQWDSYVARLRAQPGIVITESGERDGKRLIGGLRDPLAVDPQRVLRETAIDPAGVVVEWQPYQSLDPQFVLRRAQDALVPPATVTLTVDGDRIVATGSASSIWLQRARVANRLLPAGMAEVDLSQVRDLDEHDEQRWESYVARLRAEPGIAITEIGKRDAPALAGAATPAARNWVIGGLRDPLAADPAQLLRESSIDPARVIAQWQPYQSLNPRFVLRRAQEALAPPATVTLALEGDRLVAVGSAPAAWLARARAVSQVPPAGVAAVDLAQVRDLDAGDERLWANYVARLRAEPGITITEIGLRDGKWSIRGLRDPLAADPQLLLSEAAIDPARVAAHWEPYQSLQPEFVLKRVQAAFAPPPTVSFAIAGDRLVASGSAPAAWLARARAVSQVPPAGLAAVDLAQVRDLDAGDERLWASYVARLRAEPGIAITEIGLRDGKWSIRGLRDPLAADPQVLLSESSIDPTRVAAHWEPYQSLQPEFVLKRVQAAFAPPPTVNFAIAGDRIVATGTAPLTWINRTRAASRMLPAGTPAVDLSQVRDAHDGVLGKLRDAIQSKEIRFDYNVPLPSRGQEATLDRLAADIKELTALSSTLRVTLRVTLTGHSDQTGVGLYNLALSLARAEAVRTLLKQRGVDPDLLSVRSAGTLEPREQGDTEAARSANRRVSFTVGIDE